MLEKQGELLEDVRNYQWMIRECERIAKDIGKEESNSKGLVSFKDLQGGYSSTKVNTRLNETRNRYRRKIKRVNDVLDLIENDRDYAVYNCLMDGMNLSEVSDHIGIDRRTVSRTIEGLEKKERARGNHPTMREIRAHES